MSKLLNGITRNPNRAYPLTNPPSMQSDIEGRHELRLKIKGRVRFKVGGPDEDTGDFKIKQETPWFDNILTNYGLASLASAVGSSAAVTASSWVQALYIGTSTTAPASTDTSLGASTASLTMGNASFTKTNTGARSIAYTFTIASNNPAGSCVIGEVGLYCNSTGNETQNNLAAHATLATQVSKGASDVISGTYTIIFTTA